LLISVAWRTVSNAFVKSNEKREWTGLMTTYCSRCGKEQWERQRLSLMAWRHTGHQRSDRKGDAGKQMFDRAMNPCSERERTEATEICLKSVGCIYRLRHVRYGSDNCCFPLVWSVSEMTCTVSSGTLNSSRPIPLYHWCGTKPSVIDWLRS